MIVTTNVPLNRRAKHILSVIVTLGIWVAAAAQDCSRVTNLPGSGVNIAANKTELVVTVPVSSHPAVAGQLTYQISRTSTEIKITFPVTTTPSTSFDLATGGVSICEGSATAVLSPPGTPATVPAVPAQPGPPAAPGAAVRTLPATASAFRTAYANAKAFVNSPEGATTAAQDLGNAAVDLSAPESPALVVLGLSPQQVVRANSPQELVSNLLNGFDDHGNFQSGIALDFIPVQVFGGKPDIGEYATSYLTRLLNRFSVSIATVKGVADKDPSAKLALGFRATLWEAADAKLDMNTLGCITTLGAGVRSGAFLTAASAASPRTQMEEYRSSLYNCKRESADKDWGSSALVVAYAPSFRSPDGSTSNLKYNGGAVWTSFAYGFEGKGQLQGRAQLIFHARYRTGEEIPDPTNASLTVISKNAGIGGQLRVGSADFTGSFEGLVFRTWLPGGKHDQYSRISLGVDKKIADNLWLNLAYIRTEQSSVTPNNNGVQASFKWNFNGQSSGQ